MEKRNRKHPRLKNYDYSLPGYYYITVHLERSAPPLSRVGRGLTPAGAATELTQFGELAMRQLFELERRYDYVRIDKYVVMPTHIHAIIQLLDHTGAPTVRPALPDIVCAYKSLTTREVNKQFQTPGAKLFQTSFYETVLRNERAYQECWRYIDENPQKWMLEPEDM